MLAKRGIRWESDEHLAFTDAVFEHINYAAVKADTALALSLIHILDTAFIGS